MIYKNRDNTTCTEYTTIVMLFNDAAALSKIYARLSQVNRRSHYISTYTTFCRYNNTSNDLISIHVSPKFMTDSPIQLFQMSVPYFFLGRESNMCPKSHYPVSKNPRYHSSEFPQVNRPTSSRYNNTPSWQILIKSKDFVLLVSTILLSSSLPRKCTFITCIQTMKSTTKKEKNDGLASPTFTASRSDTSGNSVTGC